MRSLRPLHCIAPAALALALVIGSAGPSAAQEASASAAALAPTAMPAAPVARVQSVKLETPAHSGALRPVTRMLSLDVNKSRIIRLSRPARDVLVANPAIADIALRSPDTAFVIGRRIGETNVYFFDADGHQIDGVDLTVKFDSDAVAAVLHQMIPGEQINIATANQSLILSGSVASAQEADNARQIARQFVADDNSIINLLKVRDKSQVLLRVRVSEMARSVVKELGITPGQPTPFNFHLGGSSFSLAGNTPTFTNTPFAALSGAFPITSATTFTTLLQALESNGLVKTLAEPNLTAVSGETASFLVGGQFPVPSPQPGSTPGSSIVTVVYKDFGVRLTFTPIVLSSGLINLKIATEVSQLSTQGEITVSGLTIPALATRRAVTTVELPSGGSIAIAGLLQNDIQNTIQGFPLLKDVPVLGTLFSSTQFQHNESDLVIAVTPLLVKPVDPNALSLPTDGFGPASDLNMYLLGRLNATYGKPTPEHPRGQPQGPFGYILD